MDKDALCMVIDVRLEMRALNGDIKGLEINWP